MAGQDWPSLPSANLNILGRPPSRTLPWAPASGCPRTEQRWGVRGRTRQGFPFQDTYFPSAAPLTCLGLKLLSLHTATICPRVVP